MSEHSTQIESTMQSPSANRPLLSALTRLWSPAVAQQAADPDLGYESALPWTVDGPRDTSHAPY